MQIMNKLILCGIFGDITGSQYEKYGFYGTKDDIEPFSELVKYTDDTVCTISVMEWLNDDCKYQLKDIIRKRCKQDLARGYGGMFIKWVMNEKIGPYNSYGNGSAMRVSPVGWYAKTEQECLELAKKTAEITHNHPDGIKGAQAISMCIFMAKNWATKNEIKSKISQMFGYDLDRNLSDIMQNYKFDVTCNGSVPESIIAFIESKSIEDAVANAIILNGDTDTQAIMSGAIAECYYSQNYSDDDTYNKTLTMLPKDYVSIIENFTRKINDRILL